MDSNNRNTNNENSAPNEADIHIEPVTPKKNTQPNDSIFNKAKGLFGKKEGVETQFHVRKEPTFGEANTSADTSESAGETPNVFVSHDNLKTTSEPTFNAETTEEKPAEAAAFNEPVRAESAKLTQPEKWKLLQILPAKHRRLFLAILVLVILLIIFFALKPNSDTVESFTQQGGNEIPVQFQSLDQSQPVETTILDQQNATQAPAAETAQPETAANEAGQNTSGQKMEYLGDNAQAQTMPAQAEQPVQPIQPAALNQAATQTAAAAAQSQIVSKPASTVAQPVQNVQPVAPAVKPEPVRSAVEKPVVSKPTVSAPTVVRKPAAENTSAHTTKATNGKAPVVDAKPVQVKERKVQVVDAKPINSKATKATETKPAAASGKSKTLTVPQGVSLMQVFRDNQLNISDVNAMTKANGAGNALSSFKPGDKVTVSVNSQGRVAELRMSNGARFIRQADGSYQYKK